MSKWIETERIILRPFRLNDWKNVFKYTSNADVWKYTLEEPHSESDARRLVAHNVELQIERDGFGDHIPVILKPNHTLIGHLVFRYFYAPFRTMEIGFIIDPSHQGKGYATEAAEALVRHGFQELKLHRIVGSCDSRNDGAVRIMEKLGMRREAHLQKTVMIDGEWRDQYFYAILDEEFR